MDPSIKEPKLRVLYETLEQLLKTQEDSIAAVRGSEKEVDSHQMIIDGTSPLLLSLSQDGDHFINASSRGAQYSTYNICV